VAVFKRTASAANDGDFQSQKKLQETSMSSTADYRNAEHERSRAPEYGSTPQVTDTATEARQGVTGHNVSTVLVVSLVAVIVAFGLIYGFFFS
jgi:cobalamin biosynthesis Mg chelatase CobN